MQRHARLKPHSYAGDYEMLEKICSGRLCDHPLGRVFDRFFQGQAAPRPSAIGPMCWLGRSSPASGGGPTSRHTS